MLKHVCGTRNLGKLDEIVSNRDVDGLLEALPVQLKASDVGVLGVVLDADTNLDARWTSLKSRLVAAGYSNVPAVPSSSGTILVPPSGTILPRFGAWLMPDNTSRGILEDFLCFLVPQPSELFDHAKESVRRIPPGAQRFQDCDSSKALIHTWLAWQAEPGRPFGTAITARFLDPTMPQADLLAMWLKQLFFPEPTVAV